jgi:RNA polymerase sigma-70 factor (ECF subfamily)
MATTQDQSTANPAWFTTTHWSVVLAAGDTSAPHGNRALEKICEAYWYPLYAFIRRQQYSPQDAQDLTQEFFAWLLESKHLRLADPDRGRFRSFLLVRLKHFLCDQQKKARAQKRGGGQKLLSLDLELAEKQYRLEPVIDQEKIFDRCWALALMESTVARLRQEYLEAGRTELFDGLKRFQPGAEVEPCSYAETSKRLGLSESAIKSAIWRLRQRHRELLREEIGRTVSSPAGIDEEIRYLLGVLSA